MWIWLSGVLERSCRGDRKRYFARMGRLLMRDTSIHAHRRHGITATTCYFSRFDHVRSTPMPRGSRWATFPFFYGSASCMSCGLGRTRFHTRSALLLCLCLQSMARICPQPPAPLSRRQHRTPQDRGVVQDLSPIHALHPPPSPPSPASRALQPPASNSLRPSGDY